MQMALVSVYVGSTAVGQGLETVMAQIAADTIGKLRVLHGSTPFLDEGYGAFALRSTRMAGCEIQRASQDSESCSASRSSLAGSKVMRVRPTRRWSGMDSNHQFRSTAFCSGTKRFDMEAPLLTEAETV
jgi:hypothetical protein